MTTKKRAQRGSGTVFEDKARSRYIGQIVIDGKRHSVYGRTKTEARAKISALLKASGSPDKPAESRLTVAEVVDQWLTRDLAGRDRAPSTVDRAYWAAGHIKKLIGKKRAAALTVRQVDDMLDQLADGGLSRASISKIQQTLSQALKFAVRRGELTRNAAADATLPPSAPRTIARRSLAPDQARTLLATLRTEHNGALFALSLLLGLRPGEATGAYWDDITGNVLNVTRAVRLTKGRAEVVDDLKTSAAKRTVEMPPDLTAWIGEHRRDQLAERVAATMWVDERLVFASPRGNVLSPPNVRRQLADICERIEAARVEADPEGTPFPTIKPNELRHSCASLLSDEGVPNELIADLLGHTTTRMVDETYRHRLRPVVAVAATATWAAG